MHTLLIITVGAGICALISGMFGMLGGIIFMGILLSLGSVASAMVVHGAVQGLANISRVIILRRFVRWDLYAAIIAGMIPLIILFSFVRLVPSKSFIFICLGLLALLVWVPHRKLPLDITNKTHAFFCGASLIALNLSAGISGPAQDLFYTHAPLNRQEIVALKALNMFSAHCIKIIYFGWALWQETQSQNTLLLPTNIDHIMANAPLWFYGSTIIATILGTVIGTSLLARLSSHHFQTISRYLITLIGLIYLARGLFA